MNNVVMLWSAYHCAHGTSCLCTLSASAFIEAPLHWVDSFYGDVYKMYLADASLQTRGISLSPVKQSLAYGICQPVYTLYIYQAIHICYVA